MEKDTVFVRGLTPGVNHDELNEIFSEIGPVKSAFVVVEKDGPNKGKSRGFGFVQYALPEDASDAVEKFQGKHIGDGKVTLHLAEKKGFKRDKPSTGNQPGKAKDSAKGQENSTSLETQESSGSSSSTLKNAQAGTPKGKKPTSWKLFQDLAESATVKKKGSTTEKPSISAEKIARTAEILRCASVMLFNLPMGITKKEIRKKAGKAGRVNAIEMPYPSDDKLPYVERTALVIFTKRSSAISATSKLSKKEWSLQTGLGSVVNCRLIDHIATNPKTKAKCRLIVRNLPFSVSQPSLEKLFVEFGPILDVRIAHADGTNKSRGFAFVQFACRVDAQAAIGGLNGKEFSGRVLAVDWAVEKKLYERLAGKAEESASVKEATAANVSDVSEAESEAASEAGSESGEEEELKVGESSEEDEVEAGDDESADEQSSDEEAEVSSGDESDSSRPKIKPGSESEINTTLFVRNILFETTQDELFDEFKRFGPIRYVKLVRGADGRSRGSGFVNFYHASSMEKALTAAAVVPPPKSLKADGLAEATNAEFRGGCGITLAGRPLLVTVAINRTQAGHLAEKSPKVKQDRRNLYLAKEGLIHAESEVVLPKGDLAKRERAEKEKKAKLQSPLFFVSPVRLSIRNLYKGSKDGAEKAVTESELKKAFREAAVQGLRAGLCDKVEGNEHLFPLGWPDRRNLGQPRVEVRLMYEDALPEVGVDDGDTTGKKKGGKHKKSTSRGKSKGYGFVEFTEHVHALAALRLLNNNPSYAHLAAGGPKALKIAVPERSRLIVEFAVENKAKVKMQQKKKEERDKRATLKTNAQQALAFASKQNDAAKESSDAQREAPQDKRRRSRAAIDAEKPVANRRNARDQSKSRTPEKRKAQDDNNSKTKKPRTRDETGNKKRKPEAQVKPSSKKAKQPKESAKVDENGFRALVDQFKASLVTEQSKSKRWFDE